MFSNALAQVTADLSTTINASEQYNFNPSGTHMNKPFISSRNQTIDIATPRMQVEPRITCSDVDTSDEKSIVEVSFNDRFA
jgi:hypothetical protein